MRLKTERLTLKVALLDKEALRRIAAIEGESMSTVVRRLIRREAQRRRLMPPHEVSSHLALGREDD